MPRVASGLPIRDRERVTIFVSDQYTYWLSRGHHRFEAYQQTGRTEMPVHVKPGTKWDAIRLGIEDNHRHKGERLTSADKRRAIEVVLDHDPSLPDREIARLCGATHPTVAKCRAARAAGGKIYHDAKPADIDRHDCEDPSDIPSLSADCAYRVFDSRGRVAAIDPHPEEPGFCFITVLEQLSDGSVDALGGVRGHRFDEETVRRILARLQFVPDASTWIAEPFTGEFPPYIPSAAERRNIEYENLAYFEKNGRWPWEDSESKAA
jgi:hypothetical protein